MTAELRLHKITDSDAATRYMNEIFILRYSERFGVVPEDANAAWRKIPDYLDCPLQKVPEKSKER